MFSWLYARLRWNLLTTILTVINYVMIFVRIKTIGAFWCFSYHLATRPLLFFFFIILLVDLTLFQLSKFIDLQLSWFLIIFIFSFKSRQSAIFGSILLEFEFKSDIILIFITWFIIVLKLEFSNINRAAGQKSESFSTLNWNYFQNLNPHFSTEVNGEDERGNKDCTEYDPCHDLTLHNWFTLTCLVVKAWVNGKDNDKERERLHGIQSWVIVWLQFPLDHEEYCQDENCGERLYAWADGAQEDNH